MAHSSQVNPSPPRDDTPAVPIVVRSLVLVPTEIQREHRGYGVARAVRAVDVAAEIDGVIIEKPIRLEEGARVDRGEMIVRIDPADYQSRTESLERNIQAIEAQITQLGVEEAASHQQVALTTQAEEVIEREITRLREASDRGAATANELDQQIRARIVVTRERISAQERLSAIVPRRAQLTAQAASLRADADRAQRDLSRTAIESPIVGVLQTVDVEIGERVRTGDRIARVVDPSRLEAPLRMPVSATSEIRVGDTAVLRADGPSGGEWTGTIVRLAPEADPDTRTFTVFAVVSQDTPEGRAPDLPPGRFVLGTVYTSESQRRLIIPRGAVIDDRVLIIAPDGTIESRSVTVDFYIEARHPELVADETQWAVIADGLAPGETVAITNLSKLRPLMSVVSISAGSGGEP